MDRLFEQVKKECEGSAFLEGVLEKAHYGTESRELLWEILEKLLGCMEQGACWSEKETGKELFREVVMTLGSEADRLQEAYLEKEMLTEAYMMEVLGSEVLLLAYSAYNDHVRENTPYVVRRLHFPGMPEEAVDCSLEGLSRILSASGLPVTCTEGYCMIPKKSVAFYAELTEDRSVRCEGICMGCGRKDCPNRMGYGEEMKGNRVLDRPLTYGYSRIFGLKG